MKYHLRVVDGELAHLLGSAGAVVIEGPKACGKTFTARQVAASSVFLDTDSTARQAASVTPDLVLDGARPRLLDEWQVEPQLWNHVRRSVDDTGDAGCFILTGSAVPPDDEIRHTGAGRFARLRMRPMSWFESGHSTAQISLRQIMDGGSARSPEVPNNVHGIAEHITAGGWPALQGRSVTAAAQSVRDYLEQVIRLDVERVDGVRRDPARLRSLVASLARNVATEAAVAVLAADAGGADGPLTRATTTGYLDALERVMVVEEQPAWDVHLRSKARLRSAPKRHFVDPSLAVAALRAGPDRLVRDLNYLGLLFESLVVRDLRVYAQPHEGTVRHYRDSNGLEVDAVVDCADGRWAAFEVKLGASSDIVNGAARTLHRFADTIDTTRCGPPAALGVITGSGYGFTRSDGVHVIPLGALGP